MKRIHAIVRSIKDKLQVLVPGTFDEKRDLDKVIFAIFKYKSDSKEYVYVVYPKKDFHTLEAYLQACKNIRKHDFTGECLCYITHKEQIPEMFKKIL